MSMSPSGKGKAEREYFDIIMNYLHAGNTEMDKKKLSLLRKYLLKKGINKTLKELRIDIEIFRAKMAQREDLDTWEAKLFTREGEKRPEQFRFGSAFCPKCGMYKNYEKECPYCGFHEMTL